MNRTKEAGVFEAILRDAYAKIFYRNWPVWLGGLLIGLAGIITFALARPFGVVGGLREWIDWAFYLTRIYDSHPQYPPHISSGSVLTFGLLWGAFSSALLSKQFGIKVPPPLELVRGAVGGILMGIGAAMAMGCNVGGFLSAASALSLSGIAMMAGLITGSFLEVRYLFWEMQVLRFKRGDGRPKKPDERYLSMKNIQPYIGAAALLAAFVAAFAYRSRGIDAATGINYAVTGGLLICGLFFGIVFHRSRFAFVQAFRDPFANGNAEQSRGMAIAVIVSVLGFAALKGSGLRPEGAYVTSTFWVGSFIGGIIFGFGMPFAGGCASGTCWRLAEGNLKQVIALVFMGVSNSLSKTYIDSSSMASSVMGRKVFLPHYISYQWTVVLIIGLMLLYYLVMTWNEKTRAFV